LLSRQLLVEALGGDALPAARRELLKRVTELDVVLRGPFAPIAMRHPRLYDRAVTPAKITARQTEGIAPHALRRSPEREPPLWLIVQEIASPPR
jgi:hypothetical protein